MRLTTVTSPHTSLSATTPSNISSTLSLILCFLAFICGQLFHAYCTSIYHIKIESIVTVVPVDAGFSLKTLIAIVLSVLIVHDLVLLLVLRHVYRTAKYQPKISLKTLLGPAAVATAASARHTEPRLLLLPPTSSQRASLLCPTVSGFHDSPPQFPGHSGFGVSRFLIDPSCFLLLPPFPGRSGVGAPHTIGLQSLLPSREAVLPLIEFPAALALITKRVSNQLPFVSLITGGRTRIHDFKPLFVRLDSLGNTGSRTTALKLEPSNKALSTCSASIEEDKEDNSQIPAGRYFYVPFLRHVAAAAPVRRLQLKVHDEPSYASIEEVTKDVGKVEAVEKILDAAEEIKKVGKAAKKVVTVVQENQIEKVVTAVEAAEDTIQTVIVAEISSATGCEEKEKIEAEKKVELNHSAVDKVEAVGEATVTQNAVAIISPARSEEKKVKVVAEDNSDTPPYEYLNDLPSYEEFVNGAPPEPLFEQKSFELSGGLRHLPAGDLASEPRLVTAECLSTISSSVFPSASPPLARSQYEARFITSPAPLILFAPTAPSPYTPSSTTYTKPKQGADEDGETCCRTEDAWTSTRLAIAIATRRGRT
ncbi:hypothetical protein B0H14DRAFT_3866765 [Mycena olivaceomarginata]|nr:hypothetical protein B0H14DRAFT_3866765 [Mycena olivaceomarginata]